MPPPVRLPHGSQGRRETYADIAVRDQTSPTSPQSPLETRPLTPLSYLSSPVPDLAATLSTEAADRADEANVAFLRDSLDELEQLSQQRSSATWIDSARDPRQRRSQARLQSSARHEAAEDLSRRERLQRILSTLNREHRSAGSVANAYGNRTPSPHRQSLYDWAPGSAESQSPQQEHQQEGELDAILAELRRQQPDTHPDILRVLGQSQLDSRREAVAQQRGGNGTPAPGTQSQSAEERRERMRERERRRRETEWVNLRTRAAMQRSRHEGSPSATERMLRYVMDRERSGMSEEEVRARDAGWFQPRAYGNAASAARWGSLMPASGDASRDRERQERIEAFRRGYLAENVPPRFPRVSTPPAQTQTASTRARLKSTDLLEHALQYLSDLRSIPPADEDMTPDDRRVRDTKILDLSIDHGLATKEFWAGKYDDFVMDLNDLDPLSYSSWLQPGTIFDGHQHATNPCFVTQPSRSSTETITHVLEQINPNYASHGPSLGFDRPPGSSSLAQPAQFDATQPWLSHIPSSTPQLAIKSTSLDSTHDHWPVRVILHHVDPVQMTLQGTMEAYDVPQHPAALSLLPGTTERPRAGNKHAPIVTYLEGHIIDLRTHTLLTPSPSKTSGRLEVAPQNRTPYTDAKESSIFPPASPSVDAANWLKLPPFSTSSSYNTADDVARALLSKSALRKLNEEYIFMRWKERCFVHARDEQPPCSEGGMGDQDRGHGLTISGFYYVSLKRETGEVEGLYFDPSSTPFQLLRLRGKGGRWAGVELR